MVIEERVRSSSSLAELQDRIHGADRKAPVAHRTGPPARCFSLRPRCLRPGPIEKHRAGGLVRFRRVASSVGTRRASRIGRAALPAQRRLRSLAAFLCQNVTPCQNVIPAKAGIQGVIAA
ncbi:hypothetical protein [Lysobacter enzymogenes]|uniref:hypothetical protein n=1 Tax=Lysobacter enzymogenes TaxID=69 RepID=UPI0011AB46A7|nr:hypothetical protein [Lysobacter enzymogenes]